MELGRYVRIDELKMGMEIVSLDIHTGKLVKDEIVNVNTSVVETECLIEL